MSDISLKQYWETQVIGSKSIFPFIVIDNWYTPNEEKAVWKELDHYCSIPKDNILRSENTTAVAKDEDGNSKSRAYRFDLNSIYAEKSQHFSPIFNCMYKQRSEKFHNIIKECMPYARSFLSSNADSSLISYYEDQDYYKAHHDTPMWTNLIWMVREPRKFKGGDFKFDETDIEVKLKNNRAIFFPSCFLHSVSPIKFDTKPDEIGFGRYCITHFYFNVPYE